MNLNRRLAFCRVGDQVNIQGIEYKVERINDTKSPTVGLEPDTIRRRPFVIRSRYYVRLRNAKNGRLKTTWLAEHIPCLIVGDIIRTEHSIKRSETRKIPMEDMELVVKFGVGHSSIGGRIIYQLDPTALKNNKELGRLKNVRVVMLNNIILTAYKINR